MTDQAVRVGNDEVQYVVIPGWGGDILGHEVFLEEVDEQLSRG